MNAALHGYYEFSSEFTRDEIAFMSDSCRYRESGNIFVRNSDRILYLVCQFTETAAQDDSRDRDFAAEITFHVLGSFKNSFNSSIHNMLILNDFCNLFFGIGQNSGLILNFPASHHEAPVGDE